MVTFDLLLSSNGGRERCLGSISGPPNVVPEVIPMDLRNGLSLSFVSRESLFHGHSGYGDWDICRRDIPAVQLGDGAAFGGSKEFRKDKDSAEWVMEDYSKIEGDFFGPIYWEKGFLSPKAVNQHSWWLGCTGVVLHLCIFGKLDIIENGHHVFDERSKRPLPCDLFGMAQEGLTNLDESAQVIGKDISSPFPIKGGSGQSEEIRRWLVHQLVTLAGRDATVFVITERVVNCLSFDGMCLNSKRNEGCSQRFGLFALQKQNNKESQVFGWSVQILTPLTVSLKDDGIVIASIRLDIRLVMWLLKVLWTFGAIANDLLLMFALNLAEYDKLWFSWIHCINCVLRPILLNVVPGWYKGGDAKKDNDMGDLSIDIDQIGVDDLHGHIYLVMIEIKLVGFPTGTVYAKVDGANHVLVLDDYEVVVMMLQPRVNTLLSAWISYSEEVENFIAVVGQSRVFLISMDFMEAGKSMVMLFNSTVVLQGSVGLYCAMTEKGLLYDWVSVSIFIGRSCDKNQDGLGRLISGIAEDVLRAAGKLYGDSGNDVELVFIDCNVCTVMQMAEYNKETKEGYKMIAVDGTEYDGLDYRMSVHLNDITAAEGSFKMIEMSKKIVQILFVSSCIGRKGRLHLWTVAGKKLIDRDSWTMFWAAMSNGPVREYLLAYDGIGWDEGPEGGGLLSDLMPSWQKLCLACRSIL